MLQDLGQEVSGTQVALLGLDSGEVRAAQYVTDEVRIGLERIAARAKELKA